MKKYAISLAAILMAAPAIAVEQPTQRLTLTQEQINGMLKGRKLPPKTQGLKSAAATVIGWNDKTCVQSFTANYGPYSATFAINSDGSMFYDVWYGLETTFQSELTAVCLHTGGNYAVHITNATNGTYDALYFVNR
jgi:hypothetical protein